MKEIVQNLSHSKTPSVLNLDLKDLSLFLKRVVAVWWVGSSNWIPLDSIFPMSLHSNREILIYSPVFFQNFLNN